MRRQLEHSGYVFAIFLSVASALSQQPPPAPPAEVTFYTHGSQLTSDLPGSKHTVFWGNVFDGNTPLFRFKDGFFLHNNAFITLQFQPGAHTFTASYGNHPGTRSPLTLNVIAGQHYFVRAQAESEGIVVFEWDFGRLDLVSCTVAHQQARNGHPLKEQALSRNKHSSSAAIMVVESNLPACS